MALDLRNAGTPASVPEPAPPVRAEALVDRDTESQHRVARGGHVPPAPSANTIEPIQGDRAAYRRGLDHYRAREYRAAADEFDRVVQRPQPDARTLVPSALHHLARSHRQRGDCANAIRHYENLFSRYRSYNQTSHAQIEAADCYRRRGQLSRARSLLQLAERNAATQAIARRELARIDVLERGQRRRSRARPAAVDEAASTSAY